jgi:hypothetical protein
MRFSYQICAVFVNRWTHPTEQVTVTGMGRGRTDRPLWRRFARAAKAVVVVYLAAFVVGPFAYVSVTGASCSDWATRPVDRLEASWEEALTAVADTRIVDVSGLPAGASAAVLPGVTLVSADAGVRTVFHEAAHHVQIDQAGIGRYLVRYSSDWARGMYHGCGPYDAYRGVGYEIQARAFAHSYAGRFVQLLGDDLDGRSFARALADLERAGLLDDLVALRDRRPVANAVVALVGDEPVDELLRYRAALNNRGACAATIDC